jgi:GNAT superfamily N-acetyltransferase
MQMEIKEALTKEQILFCGDALLEFRQNINPETYADQILNMMKAGFKLIYIPNEDNSSAAAIAGFRIFEMLRTVTMIYIDDLFTAPSGRGKGYAGALLDYIDAIAVKNGIATVHLDSGHLLHPAHRLYLNKGYTLAAHHFAKKTSL